MRKKRKTVYKPIDLESPVKKDSQGQKGPCKSSKYQIWDSQVRNSSIHVFIMNVDEKSVI